MKLTGIKIENLSNPIGIDVKEPRFSWRLVSAEQNILQSTYQIRIYDKDTLVSDTGVIHSDICIAVKVPGFCAAPMTCYTVLIKVTDNRGNHDEEKAYFETGRMDIPFSAKWIEPVQELIPAYANEKVDFFGNAFAGEQRDFSEFLPPLYIRIPFKAEKAIKKARIYMTAHGIYRLYVNGVRPDDRELAPEYTSYHKVLLYQTYDIGKQLTVGNNVIGIILADGWWRGRVGSAGTCCQYGEKLGILMQCDIEYEDGTSLVVTGENAVSTIGPHKYADIFVGESYDARKEIKGWMQAGYDDSRWNRVEEASYADTNLTGQSMEPVRSIHTLAPVGIIHTPKGETLIDMGQVIAGVMELSVDTSAGIEICLEHCEVLDRDGNFYNNIMGTNKEQMDLYITKEGKQTWRPFFTFHGFRYVRVSGWPGKLTPEMFKAYVYSTDMEDIGEITTSDHRINRLQQNIRWSQIANTISVPTDCPQRERVGWTGDIMIYAPTMFYNRNAAAFIENWMNNLRADQTKEGIVPDIVPFLPSYHDFLIKRMGSITSSGWGDAVVFVPWAAYRAYGDRNILLENYMAMKQWLSYVRVRAQEHHPEGYETWDEARQERSRFLWNTDFHYGDWLMPSMVLPGRGGKSPRDTALATKGTMAPAYYALTVRQMAEIAHVLGESHDEKEYRALYEKIKQAFVSEYIYEDGSIDGDYQGIYVVALQAGLVPEKLQDAAINRLCAMIEANDGCLDTGFLSVPFIMDVLCEHGKYEVAEKLLFQTKCPSWLYEVEHGATTIWETWGGVTEDGEVSHYSYNHYAFGCVGDWMYRVIAGLNILKPGYKMSEIRPVFCSRLDFADASVETPYGRLSSRWKRIGDKIEVTVEVPVNTTSRVILPGIVETIGSGRKKYVVDRS